MPKFCGSKIKFRNNSFPPLSSRLELLNVLTHVTVSRERTKSQSWKNNNVFSFKKKSLRGDYYQNFFSKIQHGNKRPAFEKMLTGMINNNTGLTQIIKLHRITSNKCLQDKVVYYFKSFIQTFNSKAKRKAEAHYNVTLAPSGVPLAAHVFQFIICYFYSYLQRSMLGNH